MSDQSGTIRGIGQNVNIVDFVDKLIDEKQYKDITPEIKDEMRKDLLKRIDDFIMSRIIASLIDENLATFEKMLNEKRPEEEIQKFISESIPDFEGFLTGVLLEFRNVYLGLVVPPVVLEGSGRGSKPPPAPLPVSAGEGGESTDLPPPSSTSVN